MLLHWRSRPLSYAAGCQPYAETSAPSGIHLHPSLEGNIWRGKFVDLFSLLFCEPEPNLWTDCGAINRELEQHKLQNVERNWNNWLSGYIIYMAMVLQARRVGLCTGKVLGYNPLP